MSGIHAANGLLWVSMHRDLRNVGLWADSMFSGRSPSRRSFSVVGDRIWADPLH